MFGLHEDIRLKRDILEVLDTASDFLTYTEIRDILKYPAFNRVKKTCKELQAEFDRLFTKEEVEFIIKISEGVKINRYSTTIHRLVEDMLAKDFVYDLVDRLLKQRCLSTEEYLEKNYLSRSTLYNRIKKLNHTLEQFGLHISLSNQIRLKGEESSIRICSFVLIFLSRRRLSRAFNKDEVKVILEQTQKIVGYLDIPVTESQLQVLSIFIFVIHYNVVRNPLSEEESFRQYSRYFSYKEKPVFLESWTSLDWEFYLYFIYVSNYLNPIYDEKFIQSTKCFFEEEARGWIDQFEHDFFYLSDSDKQRASITLEKQFLLLQTVMLNEDVLGNFKTFDEHHVAQVFYELTERFQVFWTAISSKLPLYEMSPYSRNISLLLMFSLTNFNFLLPVIRLYINSDGNYLHREYMQSVLKKKLTDFELIFVKKIEEADLIISTFDELTPLSHQKTIIVRATFPPNDVEAIRVTASKIVSKNRKRSEPDGQEEK